MKMHHFLVAALLGLLFVFPHLNAKAELVVGDVREKGAWEEALKGIDVVYHFAAYQDYLTDFSTFFHVNAVSTALLFEVLVERRQDLKIKKMFLFSLKKNLESQKLVQKNYLLCLCKFILQDIGMFFKMI